MPGRGLTIRETIRTISNAAKQVCAAICLQRFCLKYSISHPRLDALIEHLWAFASIRCPDEFVRWESNLNEVSLNDYYKPIDNEVAIQVQPELIDDFTSLLSDVQYLGICDAFGADTDNPNEMLLNILTLLERHAVPIPPLEAFRPSVHNSGWGMPVDETLLDSWRLLSDS